MKAVYWYLISYVSISLVGVMSTSLVNAQIPGVETPNFPIDIPIDNIPENTPEPETPNLPNENIFKQPGGKENPTNPLTPNNSILSVYTPEDKFTDSFVNQLGISSPKIINSNEASNIARQITATTGIKPAFVYLSYTPVEIMPDLLPEFNKSHKQLKTITIKEGDNSQLEIIIVTGTGKPIRKPISYVSKAEVIKVAKQLRTQIVAPQYRERKNYLKPAQKLYKWIIEPIEANLQAQKINNLVFLVDVGLRSTPLAALHDGKQFLVEKYSIGLMPSISLTNTKYTDIKETIKQSQVLAMGISESTQGQEPLPAVTLELKTLVNKLWSGKILLNQQTTLDNLNSLRRQQHFGIIHLATHADFIGNPNSMKNSYIQLWEDKLRLHQIQQLGLNNPQVEMLVLSACRSAVGNREAEIGFAGLAVLAGVKTSVGSLWAVNDGSTAALMTKFYESLKTSPIRAEALRKAQVAMLKGKIYLQNGELKGFKQFASLSLPKGSFQKLHQSLSHPYYWAAFTMIGNPW